MIFGKAISLDIEDLATFMEGKAALWLTKALTIFTLVLWVALLTMVAPLEAQTRCLIGIGGYSVIVGGAPRAPESFSISLVPFDFDLSGRRRHIFADSRATFALFAVEMTFPGVGRWMCKTFPQQML